MSEWGQPIFRARQLYRQLYVNLASDLLAVSDLPLGLRERLASETPLSSLRLVRVQTADNGLTRKALFALPGGEVVEAVLMIYADRVTACVSTQAGCGMGCVFCATGKLGLLRNLSTGEIVAQTLWAARELATVSGGGPRLATPPDQKGTSAPRNGSASSGFPNQLTNLVFMGMGEPFANYNRWWAAVERLHDPQGFNFGARRMTVSTVGLVPGIRLLANESLPVNLAISLHAPNDELRSELVPVNVRYPLADLLAATREYTQITRRRASFEYVLLQGQNDSIQHARQLANLLRGKGSKEPPLLCHVNLIPWNPVPGMPLGRSERQQVLRFKQVLQDHRIPCTVRVERGLDIAAACGQLAGPEGGTADSVPEETHRSGSLQRIELF